MFSNSNSLRSHIHKKHKDKQEQGMFKCNDCDFSVNTIQHLTGHITLRHKDKVVIKCKICEYTCLSKRGLRMHNAGVHGQNK